MGKIYDQLSIEELVVIQMRLEMGVKPGAIAVGLGRLAKNSPSESRRSCTDTTTSRGTPKSDKPAQSNMG